MIIRICIVLCIYCVFCIVPPCIPQPSHSQCLMEWEAADTMFYRILRHNTDHSGEYEALDLEHMEKHFKMRICIVCTLAGRVGDGSAMN